MSAQPCVLLPGHAGSAGSYTLGAWHRIGILDAETLQPLVILKEPNDQVGIDILFKEAARSGCGTDLL